MAKRQCVGIDTASTKTTGPPLARNAAASPSLKSPGFFDANALRAIASATWRNWVLEIDAEWTCCAAARPNHRSQLSAAKRRAAQISWGAIGAMKTLPRVRRNHARRGAPKNRIDFHHLR